MGIDRSKKWVIIVTSREVRRKVDFGGGEVVTNEGEKFLLIRVGTLEGMMTASVLDDGRIAASAVTFNSRKEAEVAAAQWDGCPWWIEPRGFEYLEVVPHIVEIQRGWRVAE